MLIDKMDINYLEGREEGREEGRRQNALKNAKKMLERNIGNAEEIAEITDLPLEMVLRLKKELNKA